MAISVPNMEKLLEAGVHFGHQVRRGNPKMANFIYGARDGVHIIDLAKSEEKLKEATNAIYELGKSGGVLLIVGTKKQAKEIVANLANESGTPYLNERWVGGLLTNFEEIKKNIRKLVSLKQAQQKGELSHYTKREQLIISQKLAKFEKEMGGVSNLEKIPDAMFIIDAPSEASAVKEANKLRITLFGMCDSNSDPTNFDYPIPANDDGIKSIRLICETLIRSYKEGKIAGGYPVGEQKPAAEVKEAVKKTSKSKDLETEKAEKSDSTQIDTEVVEEAKAIEEEIEQKAIEESERKV